MTHHSVSYLKYIQIGFEMLILCLLLIYIYLSYFQEKILASDSSNYIKASCQLVNLTQTSVPFNCVSRDSGLVTVVSLPCVNAFVQPMALLSDDGSVISHLKSHLTIKLYRNINEQLYSLRNGLDCSYLPTACDNDPDFMAKYLQTSIAKLFPSTSKQFICFVHTATSLNNFTSFFGSENLFVLLSKPDFIAYYTSIVVISFGFTLSVSILFYGILNLRTFKNKRKIRGKKNIYPYFVFFYYVNK